MHLSCHFQSGKPIDGICKTKELVAFRSSATRFPFDTSHPVGFVTASIIEYLMCLNLVFFVMCIMINATGPSLTLISITADLKRCLRALDKYAKLKENQCKMIRKFNEFIQFQSNAKRLSEHTRFSKYLMFQYSQKYPALFIF